jgi:hypothetical protein
MADEVNPVFIKSSNHPAYAKASAGAANHQIIKSSNHQIIKSSNHQIFNRVRTVFQVIYSEKLFGEQRMNDN